MGRHRAGTQAPEKPRKAVEQAEKHRLAEQERVAELEHEEEQARLAEQHPICHVAILTFVYSTFSITRSNSSVP